MEAGNNLAPNLSAFDFEGDPRIIGAAVDMGAGEGLDSRAFNVGTGVGTSVLELATVLEGIAGDSLPRNHEPERPGELRQSTLDSRLIQSRGWAPAFTLEQGLRETYQYIDHQRAGTPE